MRDLEKAAYMEGCSVTHKEMIPRLEEAISALENAVTLLKVKCRNDDVGKFQIEKFEAIIAKARGTDK